MKKDKLLSIIKVNFAERFMGKHCSGSKIWAHEDDEFWHRAKILELIKGTN